MEQNAPETQTTATTRPKQKNLTAEERNGLLQALLHRCVEGSLPKGTINDVAKEFQVTRQTVSRLWRRAKESINGPESTGVMDVSSRMHKCGRKRKELDLDGRLQEIPLNRRRTVRSAASALNIPPSSFHRAFKRGEGRVHTSAVKPFLTEETEQAFARLSHKKLNNVFLSLQKVMEQVILSEGRNNFKIPHMSKQALERSGQLPMSILVSEQLREKITSDESSVVAPCSITNAVI
eukprot:CAMPEP_0195509324 /NCGR_PEP_ID=MMETSP0794_2-20130614/2284_1 /TAXON_ID=515487 /ORGANISM="Stephanopyxis turris, Strain CCMP 815" /LENGTH=235 /DNA_ID=CAMNT_0040636505 /DNA_START=249 /DNA_END=957 /DNA_ORIENTATION=+